MRPDSELKRVLGTTSVWGLALRVLAADPLDACRESVQVDPSFAYYRDRSPQSVAAELKVNGFHCVRYIVTSERRLNRPFVLACRQLGLRVWLTVFGNGSYAPGDLPAGGRDWRMRLRDPDARAPSYTYLCMNRPAYRRWKTAQIIQALREAPFDGLEIAESFWPAFGGPESPRYGCLCEQCAAAFRQEVAGASGPPNFAEPNHPDFFRAQPELYNQWVDFRARRVAAFLDEIINGPEGVRRQFPKLPVAIWGLAADVPAPVATLREWEGMDGALLISTVRPDLYVLQTDWPDWMKPDLAPDYALRYKPFVETIRATGSRVPILLQTDIGSAENARRGRDWLRQCERAAQRAGVFQANGALARGQRAGLSGITAYEYHLARDIYESPPRPMTASGRSNLVTLVFNKRLDAQRAADPARYRLASGRVLAATVDGNVVALRVNGQPESVTVEGLSDDPRRRLFRNHPAVTMPAPVTLPVRWSTTP